MSRIIVCSLALALAGCAVAPGRGYDPEPTTDAPASADTPAGDAGGGPSAPEAFYGCQVILAAADGGFDNTVRNVTCKDADVTELRWAWDAQTRTFAGDCTYHPDVPVTFGSPCEVVFSDTSVPITGGCL